MASLIETLHPFLLSFFFSFLPSFLRMHATWSAHLSLCDCLTQIVFCKEYKFSSSSYSFLQPHVASLHLSPNIFFNVLFLDTTSLCSFLNMRGKVSHPCKTMAKIVVLNCQAPHTVFSSLMLLPSTWVQTSSVTSCSWTPPAYVLSLTWEEKFHTRVKQWPKL